MPPHVPRDSWPWARALLAFALCWMVFTWPWLLGDATIPGLAKTHFYPQLLFLAQSWHIGESPFWNPYIFAGQPQIADPSSLIFSPYALLAAFDENPGLRAFDAMSFVLLGLGGIGLLFFFRLNRWHWAGGVIAALIFAFGGATAWRMQDVNQIVCLSFLPLALLYLELALRRNNIFYAALAGLMTAVMILARNHLALLSLYLMLGRVLWFWLSHIRNFERIKFSLPVLFAAILVCAALSFVPLVLTYDFLSVSTHSASSLAEAGKGSLHPAHFLTLIVPDLFASAGDAADFWGPPSIPWEGTGLDLLQNMSVLYAGSLPVLLCGFFFMPSFWRGKGVRFMVAALAVAVVYALGKYTPAFPYIYDWVPGIKWFSRPADAGLLIGALVAPLAGYCVHRFLAAQDSRVFLLSFGCVALLGGFWLAWAVAGEHGQIITASPALLLSALTFLIGMFVLVIARSVLRTWPQLSAIILVAFALIDLRLHNGPNPLTARPRAEFDMLDRDSTHPLIAAIDRNLNRKTLNEVSRIELAMLGAPWLNTALLHRYYHTLGDNSLRLSWVSETIGASDDVNKGQRLFPPTFPAYDSPLARMLGLRLVATPQPLQETNALLDAGNILGLEHAGNATLSMMPMAFPRIWIAGAAQPLSDRRQILAQGFPPLDYRRTVLLENPPAKLPEITNKGNVTLRLYRHAEIEVETQASAGGYLVLADAWHPWWRATIDHQPATVYRANLMFRAVIVPAGDHVIRFKFDPLCGLLHGLHSPVQCKNWKPVSEG